MKKTHTDLRAKFAAASDTYRSKRKKVELPELDLTVWVRPIDLKTRLRLIELGNAGFAYITAASACDEDGNLMWDHESKEDLELIGTYDFGSIQKISDAALVISGLAPGAPDEAKKNS